MEVKTELTLGHVEVAPSQEQLPSAATEASLNKQYDSRILPLLFLIYLFSFMDRASIGNAAIEGLEKDLDLLGHEYNTALALFFVVYMIVDLPAAWICKWIGSGRFLSVSISCWGICTICLGFVTDASQLYALRCLLGFFEGGLTPVLFIYMAMFYRRYEVQKRIAWFYISGPLSGAIGGLLASGLGRISVGRYRNWPWIFFVEGACTCLVGVACFMLLPNSPAKLPRLTDEQMVCAHLRMSGYGSSSQQDLEAEKFRWSRAKQGLLDWNTVLLSLTSISVYCNLYGYALFGPTLIKAFGYHTVESQLLSVPPLVFAAIVILVTSYASDRLKVRGPFVLGSTLVQAVGWILNIACKTTGPRYFGLFLIASGAYSSIPSLAAWLVNNVHPHYAKATALGVSVSLGTCGGIIATFTYVGEDAIIKGNSIQLGMCGLTVICTTLLLYKVRAENTLRAAGGRNYRLQDGKEAEQDLGSRHPDFVLSL